MLLTYMDLQVPADPASFFSATAASKVVVCNLRQKVGLSK